MSNSKASTALNIRHAFAAIATAGALGLAAAPAQAQGLPFVDLYVGAGIGQSDVNVDYPFTNLDEKDFAWKLFGGARFASMFGAELEYIDFGKVEATEIDADLKGIAGFGMIYLPLTIVDLYAKAGLAKVDVDVSGGIDSDDTKFAWGLGVQLKLGSWGIRAEYERFKVDGAKPSLVSLGISRSFL